LSLKKGKDNPTWWKKGEAKEEKYHAGEKLGGESNSSKRKGGR